MNYQCDACGLEASRSYMVHLHLGLCPCKEIRMNRQGLFSNISLIYVRLPEQWKSVMYMPVCSEIEALVCSFGDHFFSKWSIPYRTGAIWPAGSEWWILKSFGMGSFLICVVCCIWWEKIPRFMGIPLKAFHQKVMECHGSKRAVWIPHAVVILPGRSVIEIGISEADHSSWAKLRQLRSGWLSFVTFVHNINN